MKKLILTTIIINIIALSCTSPLKSLGERSFYATQYNGNKDEVIRFDAELIKDSPLTLTYVRKGYSVDSKIINKIVDAFENEYSTITSIYGTHTDVDKNGKVILLFFNINGEKVTGGSYVGGYFYYGDLIEGYGNNAEILYIDSLNGLDEAPNTVIHEFQHLINYNMNKLELGYESDTWINEALSESAEIVYSDTPNDRIKYFNNNHDTPYGRYFYTWESIVANYASASIFMYWLGIQANNNYYIYQDIAKAPSPYRGRYQAVLNAVKYRIPDLSDSDWSKILSTWFEANYKNDQNGILGYKNKIPTMTKYVLKASIDTQINIYPGGAIYYLDLSDKTPSNTTQNGITYKIIDSTGKIKLAYNPDITINNPSPKPVTVPASTVRTRGYNGMIDVNNIRKSFNTKPMFIDKHPPLRPIEE